MELMVRGNTEKERGAKTNGRQSKLVTSVKALLVRMALYMLVKLLEVNWTLEKLERK